nr:hypothetical protein [Bradyrhizobium sp. CSS354]
MFAVLILSTMISVSFGAGYLTRDLISRRRRAEERRWAPYLQPRWLPTQPANRNEKESSQKGELGQMLTRWDQRARARRSLRRG